MVQLYSAQSPNHRTQVAEYRRHAYLANGWNAVRRWNGRSAALELAGIEGPSRALDSWTPSPSTAAGSNSNVGVHVFRYRYMDSRTGYVSNPSEEREVEIASGALQLTFAINTSGAGNILRSTDAKVDRIVLEATTVGSTEFFQAAEVANSASSIVFDMSDAELEQRLLPYSDDGHDPPPLAKNVVSHRDRIWLFGQVTHSTGNCDVTNGSNLVPEGTTDPDWNTEALGASSGDATTVWLFQRLGDAEVYEIDYYDSGNSRLVLKTNYAGVTGTDASYRIFSRVDAVWVSEPGFPESFVPLNFLNGPNGENAGDLVAGVGYGSSMLFFTENAMFKFSWDQDPLVDGFWVPVSNKYGALNQRSVIEVEGVVYAMSRRGWTAWSGVFPKLISRGVDPLRSSIDFTLAERFHCCFFPETRAVRWFVVYAGDSYPKNYVQFDVDGSAWSTGRYLQGISDSRLIPTDEGLRVLFGDENGYTWFGDEGDADGVPVAFSRLTAGVGSTTSILEINEDLPTSGTGLAGAVLTRRTAAGAFESRRITSNGSGQITLASAFSGAPSANEELWVGAIPSKLRTRAFGAPGMKKRRTAWCRLLFDPLSSARYLQVRVYEDLSSTAKAWAASRNNRPGLVYPGSNTTYPTTDWLVDLSRADGVVQIPLSPEWRRFFEVELELWEPDARLVLHAIEHEGGALGDSED